jgi:hypothetical protein
MKIYLIQKNQDDFKNLSWSFLLHFFKKYHLSKKKINNGTNETCIMSIY